MKNIEKTAPLLFVAAIVLSIASCGSIRKGTKAAEYDEGHPLLIQEMTNFTSASPDLLEIDDNLHTVTLGSNGGNHLAVYAGLEDPTNDFILEADVKLLDSDDEKLLSAALLFGVENPRIPTWKWYGANIDTSRQEQNDMFRVFGSGFTTSSGGARGDIDVGSPLHLKLDVSISGRFTYSFGNIYDKELRTVTGYIPDWEGGYVGVLTFKSQAEFSNISFVDRSVGQSENDAGQIGTSVRLSSSRTDLTNLTAYGAGIWRDKEDGLYSNAIGEGNAFCCSETKGADFVYSANVKFLQNTGTATLIFRSDSNNGRQNAYGLSINGMTKSCRFTRWQDGIAYQMINDCPVDPTEDETYKLKVVAIDSWISCYVNDVLVASTGDYILQSSDRGQDTFLAGGYFGFQNLNGEVVFQDIHVIPINNKNTPILSDISVISQNGSVEEKSWFSPTEPVRIQFVGNDSDAVEIKTIAENSAAFVTVKDENNVVYTDGSPIPINEGVNYLTITSIMESADGSDVPVNYRLIIWRRQPDDIYYNETYRNQYHYSVPDGRANDPNGLVYFNGTWHLFYQFSIGMNGGPKHWAHAVSKDLLTWRNKPIAFYPDANGSMYSGCIVVDEHNTSGLFSNGNGGLVALISVNGNGQRIKVAYSEDEGATWTKLDRIVLDWTDDPLYLTDLRDPKVFRWENK